MVYNLTVIFSINFNLFNTYIIKNTDCLFQIHTNYEFY